MILSTKARELHAAALALTNAVDACVIRADGSGTPPATRAELEALKDAAARAWAAYRREMGTMNEKVYSIDADKLAAVTEIVNADTDPAATEALIENEVCGAWNAGDEHQEWIDDADPQDIADWLATFYQEIQ